MTFRNIVFPYDVAQFDSITEPFREKNNNIPGKIYFYSFFVRVMFDILVIQKSQPVTKSLRNIPAEAATGGVI